MSHRLQRLRDRLAERRGDAVLLTSPADVRWVTGFTGSSALVVVTDTTAHLLTDGRYAVQARAEVTGAQIHVAGNDLVAHLADQDLLREVSRVLVSAEHTTLSQFDELRNRLSSDVVGEPSIVGILRAAKDDDEVEAIRAAQELTERVFDHILPMIAVGVTERDLAAEIVYQHLRRGADAMAFAPIVASGRRSALPHARASSKQIAAGDVVLVDMGCFLGGYASDMTRTLVVGQAEEGVAGVYQAVLEAQVAAIDALHGGASGKTVDAVARDRLAEDDLDGFFAHSLGHGIGLEVHEPPRLSSHANTEIPTGAVVTVEPGVYLPDRFGIRIEDIVAVRRDGAEVLTRTPKSLLVL